MGRVEGGRVSVMDKERNKEVSSQVISVAVVVGKQRQREGRIR